VERLPGCTAVDGSLQIELPDPLEMVDEEGIDGDEGAGVRHFDVAFAELRAEALQKPDLLVRQAELALARKGARRPECGTMVVSGQCVIAECLPLAKVAWLVSSLTNSSLAKCRGACGFVIT